MTRRTGTRTFRHTYPLDLTTEPNTSYFYIKELKKVERPLGSRSIFTGANRGVGDVFGSNSTEQIIGTIYLPMPLGIADGNNANWGDSTFNFLEDMGASRMGDLFNIIKSSDSFDDAAIKVKNSLVASGEMGGNALQDGEVLQGILSVLSAQALNVFGSKTTANQQLSRTQGQVLNSNLELLFDGATLRNHEFSFKLTPRSKKESDEVKRIIYQLKRGMAPSAGATNAFLNAPSVYKIGFRQGGRDHPFLFSMKTCGMKSLNVNYSASTQENYSSYYDGSPTSLDLSMSFTELSPVYSEDYDEFDSGNLDRGVGW